jgi:hypothetical protein
MRLHKKELSESHIVVRHLVSRWSDGADMPLGSRVQTVNQEIEWTLESHVVLQAEMKQFEEQQTKEDGQRAQIIRLNNQRLERLVLVSEAGRAVFTALSQCLMFGVWSCSNKKMNTEAREGAQEASLVVEKIAKKVQSLFFKMQCDQMYGAENQKSSASKGASSKSGATGAGKERKGVGGSRLDRVRAGHWLTCVVFVVRTRGITRPCSSRATRSTTPTSWTT